MRIIAGEMRSRKLKAPEGMDTRPTADRVKEALFSILQGRLYGARVLDLYAGSGALALEAISRGAISAVMVDSDRKASMIQKQNAVSLRFDDRTRILNCDWVRAVRTLEEEGRKFDIVFLDPPYAMTDLRNVFLSVIPLMEKESIIVLEHEAGKSVSVPQDFEILKDRSWGFCAVTVYRLKTEGE